MWPERRVPSSVLKPLPLHPCGLLEWVLSAFRALIGLIRRRQERSSSADPSLVIRLAPSHPAPRPRQRSRPAPTPAAAAAAATPILTSVSLAGPGHARFSYARPHLRRATLPSCGDMRRGPRTVPALGLMCLCLGEWPLGPPGLRGGEGWAPALPGGHKDIVLYLDRSLPEWDSGCGMEIGAGRGGAILPVAWLCW